MPIINWIGKEAVLNHDKEIPFRLLESHTDLDFGNKSSQNMIIEGDNLEALKALMPHFVGRVKCIYIDPPYNTGTENWVYNDNVNNPKIKKWLGKTVGRESEDLCRHDKWLCMMYPRLRLLQDLLREDGVIFVSIDDNELNNLKSIMDEIFGATNFRNCIVVRRGVKNVQAQFDTVDSLSRGHEYILVYTKNPATRFQKLYKKLEEESGGAWNNHWRGTDRPTMRYELFGIKHEKGQWRWGKERSFEAIKNYEQMLKELGKTNDNVEQDEIDSWYVDKIEELEVDKLDMLRVSKHGKPEHYIPPKDTKLLSATWLDMNAGSSADLKKLFGQKLFDNPKSLELIKRIVGFVTEEDDIILDSFAGSGTTGEAVMAVNAEDGGKRKFILVQIEEDINKPIVVDKKTYDTVFGITIERNKRAIEKYGYKEDFKAYKLGNVLFDQDGQINSECTFEQLGSYIYFTETQEYKSPEDIVNQPIGIHNDTDYYLLYKGKGKNTLDVNFLKTLDLKDDSRTRVIYADKCLVDEEILTKFNIIFKQIPYEIKVY